MRYLTHGQMRAVQALLAVARAAHEAADNAQALRHGGARLEAREVDALEKALDGLDLLPDDQPGFVMAGPARAAWALRELVLGPPHPFDPAAPVATVGELRARMSGLPDDLPVEPAQWTTSGGPGVRMWVRTPGTCVPGAMVVEAKATQSPVLDGSCVYFVSGSPNVVTR